MRVKRQTPVLDDRVSAILIGGWMTDPPSGPQHGFGATLELFTEGDTFIVNLWRQHEGYLRDLATRWGMVPEWELDGVVYFFGEYLARGGR